MLKRDYVQNLEIAVEMDLRRGLYTHLNKGIALCKLKIPQILRNFY